MNFKINSRPLFTIIFKHKNDNFQTRDFSPLIERVLVGVDKSLTKEGNESNFRKRMKLKAFSHLFLPNLHIMETWTGLET